MGKCKNCEKEDIRGIYCSNKCQVDYQNNQKVILWLSGDLKTVRKGGNSIPAWMRSYLLAEANHKCSSCGWDRLNPVTLRSPLEIDHIDGDAYNNSKDNLRVLCPNCHSLTHTFRNIGNRPSSRKYRNKPE